MFLKPFHTKTNVKIRGSDRKRLRAEVEKTFSSYDFKEPISLIISNKDEINVLKVFTNKRETVLIYVINGNPLFFDVNKQVYPTLYFLWKHSGLVPSVATHSNVIAKLANGADLMVPGIILLPGKKVPLFTKNSIVAINTESNSSAVAVGVSLKSSDEIYRSSDRQGKAVQIFHIFGDHLWELGERLQPPKIQPLIGVQSQNNDTYLEVGVSAAQADSSADAEDVNKSGDSKQNIVDKVEDMELLKELNLQSTHGDVIVHVDSTSDAISSIADSSNVPHSSDQELFERAGAAVESPINIEEKMNELLHSCFMTALKTRLKDKELPMPTGTFYRSKVLACVPSGEYLDIKKTSYKKLSKYLDLLQVRELIEVKELTKGNDHVVAVNRSHEEIKSFDPLPSNESEQSDEMNTETQFGVLTQKHYEPPEISLLYGVNAATSSLFRALGFSKGAVMETTQVRQLVTNYVRDNELIEGAMVTLDPVLHGIVFGKGNVDVEKVKWDALFSKIFSTMQIHHQLKFKGANPIIKKGNPPKIIVKLEQRMGNKKVTLVQNLEHFFIRPQDFADIMRKKAQASTSITVLPGSKPTHPLHQVLIQGNQIRNAEIILTGDSYKLPRKYIEGLQLAPKSKGKGRK